MLWARCTFEPKTTVTAVTAVAAVTAFIAGATAPPGRRMGHAGAIITGSAATAESKKQALLDAGCHISNSPGDIGITVQKMLG